jgi:nicotinate-nucleotide adenylyltransferase
VSAKRVGVIAGAFNPVTRAHVALAEAARVHVDEIVFAVPRELPHKQHEGASLAQRVEMLRRVCGDGRSEHSLRESRVEMVDGGLFVDIAREVRLSRPAAEIYVVCGRDAAERMVTWNYNDHGAIECIFRELHLLVAGRQGAYQAPDHLRTRIHSIELPAHFDEISSSEVRRRVAVGEAWQHLVPESIVDLVSEIYGPRELGGSREIS